MELKIGVWKNKSAQHSTADIYPVWKGCMYIVIAEMLWPKQWWSITFEHPVGSHFKVSHGKHPASGYALIAKSFPGGSYGKDDNEDQNSNKAIYFFEWLVFLLAVLKLGVRSTALHYCIIALLSIGVNKSQLLLFLCILLWKMSWLISSSGQYRGKTYCH